MKKQSRRTFVATAVALSASGCYRYADYGKKR